jgi:hypothetical protein
MHDFIGRLVAKTIVARVRACDVFGFVPLLKQFPARSPASANSSDAS